MSQQLKYKIRHGHNLHLYKVRVLEEHKQPDTSLLYVPQEEMYLVVSDKVRFVMDYFERVKGKTISGIDLEHTGIHVLIPDCKFD